MTRSEPSSHDMRFTPEGVFFGPDLPLGPWDLKTSVRYVTRSLTGTRARVGFWFVLTVLNATAVITELWAPVLAVPYLVFAYLTVATVVAQMIVRREWQQWRDSQPL